MCVVKPEGFAVLALSEENREREESKTVLKICFGMVPHYRNGLHPALN